MSQFFLLFFLSLGSMSDPERIFIQKLLTNLFPDTAYRFNSGGEPKKIPDLTYEQFCEFHKRFYHPSNSNLYRYRCFIVLTLI